MKPEKFIAIVVAATACMAMPGAWAQTVNIWRGEEKANWNDSYRWKLKHAPAKGETVQFKGKNSTVVLDRTVDLDNGMQLYGKELSLEGNGNINFWSPIPHQRTVYIPATATGYANLTVGENLSINGRIALAAKSFGTSAGKGTVTLKDRTTVEGKLTIGNNGTGSGKVFIQDESVYRITELDLNTAAENGGVAELHVLGGTVMIDTKDDPFEQFLADPSRKIILGKYGTLRINTEMPRKQKKALINKLIRKKRLIAAPNYKLGALSVQERLVSIQAEHVKDTEQPTAMLAATPAEEVIDSTAKLLGKIKNSKSTAKTEKTEPLKKPESIEGLLTAIKTESKPVAAPTIKTVETQPEESGSMDVIDVIEVAASDGQATSTRVRLSGFIVFSCIFLLAIRKADTTPTKPAQAMDISGPKFIDFTKAKKRLDKTIERKSGNAA
jgi:hypothetical protein